MRFGVLGPVEVHDGSGIRAVPPSARALLAMLLVERRPVPPDRLADWLWSGSPPHAWRNALQAHVKTLRRAIEPAARRRDGWSILAYDRDGYALRLARGDVDVDDFEALVQQARAARARPDPARAAQALRAALSLWRGDPYAEFGDQPWATAEAIRLDALRRQVRSEWFELELALGHHESIVGELEQAVHDDPLREPLTAQLMLALYRSGRQARALETYALLQHRLGESLGLEPSAALRRLETAILRHDSELDPVAAPATRPMLPAIVGAHAGPPFVGRNRELQLLGEALDAVEQGSSRLVLIAGEPGIGKSRLVVEFARLAHARGAGVLWGRCVPVGCSPFHPFVEALSQSAPQPSDDPWMAGTPGASIFEHVRVSEQGGTAEFGDSRHTQFEDVAARFRDAGKARPVVVVLEDLHWADEPSLLLLGHLSRHPDLSGVLLVGSFRDTDVTVPHLLATPGSRARFGGDVISLRGLSRSEVDRWVGTRFDATDLMDRSNGNPFFIDQLVHDRARRPESAGAPEAVRDLIVDRLERLPVEVRRILEAAAILGREFELESLARTATMSLTDVADALGAAEHARLVSGAASGGSLAFVHALAQEVIREQIPAAARAVAHQRAAVALEESGRGAMRPGEVAFHYARSGDHRCWRTAVAYYDIAARRARDLLAPEESVRHYEAALALAALLPDLDDATVCELLLGAGEARFRSGARSASKEAFATAAHLAPRLDPDHHARVVLGATGWYMRDLWSESGTVNPTVIASLDEALARLDSTATDLRSRLLARLAECLYFSERPASARQYAADALSVAERARSPDTRRHALHAALRTDWVPDNLEHRLRLARKLVETSRTSGDIEHRATALVPLITNLLERGDFEEADRLIERHAELADQLHYPLARLFACGLRGARALMRGDLATCERLAEQAASTAPEYFALESAYAGVYCVLRVEQGRTPEMLDAARAYVDEMPTIPAWRAGLSVLLAHSGMLEAARKEAALVIEHGGLERRNEHFLFLAGALAETVSMLDDPALATPVADALAGLEQHWVILGEGFAVWTHVSRSLGVAARARRRLDESEHLLRQSVAEHERAGARALLARSLYELSRTLALTDRRDEVEDLLRTAATIAASTGQVGLVAQITSA